MAREVGQLGEWLFLSLRRVSGRRGCFTVGWSTLKLKNWPLDLETWMSPDILTRAVSVVGREHYPGWRRRKGSEVQKRRS